MGLGPQISPNHSFASTQALLIVLADVRKRWCSEQRGDYRKPSNPRRDPTTASQASTTGTISLIVHAHSARPSCRALCPATLSLERSCGIPLVRQGGLGGACESPWMALVALGHPGARLPPHCYLVASRFHPDCFQIASRLLPVLGQEKRRMVFNHSLQQMAPFEILTTEFCMVFRHATLIS